MTVPAKHLHSEVEALLNSLVLEADRSAAEADEQLAAYVDGQLDELERELFEDELARRPELRAAAADLLELRAAAVVPPRGRLRGRLLDARGRFASPARRLLAVAASILVTTAGILVLATDRANRGSGSPRPAVSQIGRTRALQPLFAGSFENRGLGAWSGETRLFAAGFEQDGLGAWSAAKSSAPATGTLRASDRAR